MPSILIVAGENSGEKYGARLVQEFKKLQPSHSFWGIGGKNMAKEEVEILFPVEDLAVVGVFEIFCRLVHIRKIFYRLVEEAKKKKPQAAVLIDSPDFNLRLANKLKELGIPVLYYISPTVWAWRKGRLKTIKKTVAKMLLIFPFEEKIYREKEIPAAFVGHPLLERVRTSLTREEFFQKYKLDPKKKLISLLPGSRRSEIRYHMPVLCSAMEKIHLEFNAQFVLIQAETLAREDLATFLPPPHIPLKILQQDGYEAMASSDLILSACGTANLEAALLGTPFISFYRISPLTYYGGKWLVKIKNYSIVNILAGERIVPELIQRHFTADNLFLEVKKILESPPRQAEMRKNFQRIKLLLGEKNASQNAARELKNLLKEF